MTQETTPTPQGEDAGADGAAAAAAAAEADEVRQSQPAGSGFTVVSDSNDIFSTFDVTHPAGASLDSEGDEIRLHVSYTLNEVRERGGYAAAWLMDFSGSMYGDREREAKQIFSNWITRLDLEKEEIYCAVISFESFATCVSPFVKLDAESVADLQDKVNALEANGSTYMNNAFEQLIKLETELAGAQEEIPERLEIHLTSDGEAFDRDETNDRAASLLRDIQRFRNGHDDDEEEDAISGQVFTSCNLHTVAIDADDGAIEFLLGLTKTFTGTMTIRSQGQESLENVRYVDGSNWGNTLSVDIPEQARDNFQINRKYLRQNLPKDFTLYQDEALSEYHCEMDLAKGASGSKRTFTIEVLLDSLEEPLTDFHFATLKVQTHRGAAAARKNKVEVKLRISTSKDFTMPTPPAEMRATIMREAVKEEFRPVITKLKDDASSKARDETVDSLEDCYVKVEDDPEALEWFELQTTMKLIDYGLAMINENEESEMSNSEAANLLFEIFQAIDTMQIPRHLCEAIGLDNPSDEDLVPFPSGKNPSSSSSPDATVLRSKKTRKGIIDILTRKIDKIRRPSGRVAEIQKLSSELVARKSLARRIRVQMKRREKCQCDDDCACGGRDGGCYGNCGCAASPHDALPQIEE
ncbi:Hypothetical Protein FCC1311_068542 [Hondaea fermentalgiana]|uniref:VWFA domain-containing protein n=1 Tax=Hondaea fermentalgiana TaxID=2315210 RepID=A0A2R5GRX8_9STRA|nr:Hypothetical Protein FCC1311_068542 [Hondaea fermentalgiana]|eukprot:GBG30634.1 Hypothetical Protein FCC1311_068542 [Hondaea fermentalgiana]